ncbi:sigma-70 family RNA polymerase sigma factor [Muricauda sp. SCSIO 64092]|uniref:RNA polymerase sigma factor n=1 Tax=Allomuricauda sp. SCSIO 64092 TaxID=2908842 RepID=UPI001FF5B87D|nr:sigma-70 family RNA polymerase sigma factor [Muricauda sp. SCSIO 64092]UOY06417.1 sigma-70 family RNA polymerase sigma factor [Muricauda sp. SCSIO 64092]
METDIRFTHQTLVEQCKTGNPSSQYELYSLYVDAMFNVGLRFLGNKEDAEDIVQDSFVDAFKKLNSFKYESSFGAWLKRIVINKSINHLRAKRVPLVPMEAHEFHLADEEPMEADAVDVQKVKRGISQLPEGYKQIINLYLIEGYDHVEIGEILDISTSTSKSQYHRAKKKLVEIIRAL